MVVGTPGAHLCTSRVLEQYCLHVISWLHTVESEDKCKCHWCQHDSYLDLQKLIKNEHRWFCENEVRNNWRVHARWSGFVLRGRPTITEKQLVGKGAMGQTGAMDRQQIEAYEGRFAEEGKEGGKSKLPD